MDASHFGLHPLFHFGRKYIFFLAVIHLFDITYLSKCSNYSENPCKIITNRPKVERLGNTSGTNYKCQDGIYTY